MKRGAHRAVIAITALLAGLVTLVIAANVWLALWVPTHGKAWLEAQLKRALPLSVTIQTMRYSVWQGFLLDEVMARDPATATTWVHAPHVQARIGALNLVLHRQVSFRLKTDLTAPCRTNVILSGRYTIRTHRLALELGTSDIAVESLIAEVATRLPALKAGQIRLALHGVWEPDIQPVIQGRLTGAALKWDQPEVRATGDVLIEGTVWPPLRQTDSWRTDLTARIDHGGLEGLSVLKAASNISGAAHLVNDRLDIAPLRGVTAGSPWTLEGTLAHLPQPDIDLVLRTRVNLETAAAQFLTSPQPWHPKGDAEVVIACRGPLASWPNIELMVRAAVQNASVQPPHLSHRLERLSASLQYDHLTKRLAIDSLSARLQDAPVSLHGVVRLTTPATLDLTADTEADLALFMDLLPADSAIRTLAGPVTIHLTVGGTATQPTWDGTATLTHATAGWRHPDTVLKDINGSIRFTNQGLASQQLAFRLAEQPLTLSGTVTDLATSPKIVGQLRFATGMLTVRGIVQPEALVLEDAALDVGTSSLHARGRLSRLPHQASQLTMKGALELSDLFQLPWVDLKEFQAWDPRGRAEAELRLSGPLEDWQAVSAIGFVRANQLLLRGLPVGNLNAELEQGQGRLSVRLTNAVVAGGKLIGEFLLEQQATPNRFLLESDLTMADLEELAAAIPAWHDSRIQGTLSGRVSLLGVWKDRASLHGEGWLNAVGDRLGEVPLLNRLFHGVFGALADRLGLATLRKAQITKIAGQWRLAQERMTTDDLRVVGVSGGTEPVTITLRGSVGLDKTLDLVVEPELPEQLVLQAPNTSSLSNTILKVVGGMERLRRMVGRHHLGGTIDKPQYKFEFSLDQLLNQTLPSEIERLLNAIR